MGARPRPHVLLLDPHAHLHADSTQLLALDPHLLALLDQPLVSSAFSCRVPMLSDRSAELSGAYTSSHVCFVDTKIRALDAP